MNAEALEWAAFAAEEACGVRLDLLDGTGYWSLDGTVAHAEALRRIAESVVLAPGFVLCERVFVRFADGSLLRPDLAIYSREPDEQDTAVTLVPAAVIEIVSSESRRRDLEIVPEFCLARGVGDVVVFNPYSGITARWQRDGAPACDSEGPEIRLECGCLVTV